MATTERIIATTNLVDQMILTVESLEENAHRLSESKRKPAISIEHDPLCPPVGQMVSGRVIRLDNGHHALVAGDDMFPEPVPVTLPNGDSALMQSSAQNRFGFVHAEFEHPASFTVRTDPQNFGGIEGYESFVDELQRIAGSSTFEAQPTCRRSWLPDPLVVFTVSLSGSMAVWAGARIGKAAGEVLEREVKAFLDVVIAAVKKAAAAANPISRPVTYVLQLHGQPNVELVAKSRNAELVISAMLKSSLDQVKKQADEMGDSLNAEFVQFVMQDDGTWKFNYLLCNDGKVIGSRRAFSRRAIQINAMKAPSLPAKKRGKK
jgi:hypothetical protein